MDARARSELQRRGAGPAAEPDPRQTRAEPLLDLRPTAEVFRTLAAHVATLTQPHGKPVPSAPVVQRAMGMELETRRTIVNPDGSRVEDGDTDVIDHPYFKLVTDHFKGSSNLEFVMKHFDQLTVSQDDALGELGRRLTAMHALWTQLYAAERRVGEDSRHGLTAG